MGMYVGAYTHTHTQTPLLPPSGPTGIMGGDLVSRLYRFLEFQPKKSQLLTTREMDSLTAYMLNAAAAGKYTDIK